MVGVSQQQLTPYVKNYSKLNYEGEALVWGITQTADRQLYFANNKILLQFDGNRWQHHWLPEKTIIRSVFAVENKVFTGSYMEFGYWEMMDGHLTYTSLSKKFKLFEEKGNDEVWNIFSFQNKIYFQTFFSIYIYDGKTIKTVKTPSQITYAFPVKNQIYVASITEGIYRFENGAFYPDKRIDQLKNKVIHSILPYRNGLMIFTQKEGVFIFENDEISSWKNDLNKTFQLEMINSALRISDSKYAVGTSGDGLYLVDIESGNYTNLHKNNGSLQNNSVLSIFQDKESNLWLGLDNGISFVQNDANSFVYQDFTGKLGSVNAIQKTENGFLLGSNHGLYALENGKLQLIPGTQGPVWSIAKVGSQFIIGHNNATMIYEGGNLQKINALPGGYRFEKQEDNLYYQANYVGLYQYQFINGNWVHEKLAPKLIKPINQFFKKEEFVLATDMYRGVYKINLENNEFVEVQAEDKSHLYNSKMVEINQQLYFLSNRIWYELDNWSNQLKKSDRLNELLPTVNNILPLGKDIFLVESNSILSVVKIENQKMTWVNIPDKYYKGRVVNDWISGYLKNNYLYLNLDNGFLVHKVSFEDTADAKVFINAEGNGKQFIRGEKLGYYNNAIDFFISTRKYGYADINLYYKLSPSDQKFQPIKNGKISYTHLPNDSYSLVIASKSGKEFTVIDTFDFTVKKPWFISNLMILIYLVLVFLVYFLYHSFIQRQNKQKLAQLQHEIELQKELVCIKTEAERKEAEHWVEMQKLEQDIKSKTSELASKTLSVASQSELLKELESIQKGIEENTPTSTIKKDISKILRDYNYNQNEWKVFDTNLNELHEDFVSRLVKSYPNLTPKDIRLAILLRMNMSSKEIAPLMRKSFRSVELQRYRLRKKLKLSSKTNLSKFFIEF
ncbi:hypothetical protein HU137_07410 [Moheibacter sp. BDHS18]|uniref:HTH luxR-type domain-containing protein n=2 Tax=Moheibacter lacus TaxID=2745851 RepID=A0A838ZQP0_9FLAO|nr:hypothetical protein [Moheibacter lacus]